MSVIPDAGHCPQSGVCGSRALTSCRVPQGKVFTKSGVLHKSYRCESYKGRYVSVVESSSRYATSGSWQYQLLCHQTSLRKPGELFCQQDYGQCQLSDFSEAGSGDRKMASGFPEPLLLLKSLAPPLLTANPDRISGRVCGENSTHLLILVVNRGARRYHIR